MLLIAWPACVRSAQASAEFFACLLKNSGTSRMPFEPSAWHDWQEFFTVSSQ